ncbi:MAG: 1-deoxy-D-xylulose-5-phosphate reductoisomerase [candidate division WOR-3 bacterium]
MKKTSVAIFGSTGSIGRSAVDVISHLIDRFQPFCIAAHQAVEQISLQAQRLKPRLVILTDPKAAEIARSKLGRGFKVLAGLKALADVAQSDEVDILIMAMSGTDGLIPVLKALRAGKRVALATKEILVAYGELVMRTARRYKGKILPIDSELCALHQCLDGRDIKAVRSLILTASGGPFWRKGLPEDAKLDEVLNHPTWKMGRKITVDSATLMNKGLEVIETVRLFGVKPEQVKTVIHPESIVHSMVEFVDGALLAQMSNPDMRLSIQYCLTYPERLASPVPPISFENIKPLRFFPVDLDRFPCLKLAYQALKKGPGATCVLNAANEIAVAAFLNHKIAFGKIPVIIAKTLKEHLRQKKARVSTLRALRKTENWAKGYALNLIERHRKIDV